MKLANMIEILHRHAHRQWAGMGSEIGVSHSEFEYLRAIKEQEARMTDNNDHGQHLQDVVAQMGVKKASASAMVVKLEDRGLVERLPCRFDARAQHILLTAAGNAVLKQGEGVYESAASALLSELSEADRGALKTCLSGLSLK